MKKAFAVSFCTFMLGAAIFAQNKDENKKVEFFAGYSRVQLDTGFTNREGLNGFEGAAVYNFSRYFGVKGDVSAAFSTRVIPFVITPGNTGTLDSKRRLLNFLGGIQVKDNANSGRFKPFAHALVGVGQNRFSNENFRCTGSCAFLTPNSTTHTGIAGAFGGGLDIRVNDRIQVRAIQVDYNPMSNFFSTLNNVRISAGIVF